MLKENIDILGFDVIEKIIKNNKLQIACEDQLVSFINEIYIHMFCSTMFHLKK